MLNALSVMTNQTKFKDNIHVSKQKNFGQASSFSFAFILISE